MKKDNSVFHPDIIKLELVSIDTAFSAEENRKVCGRDSEFYVVPTDMVISGERELWKGCPPLVNWDILKCIEDIIESGKYPYNTTVGELFIKRNGLTLEYNDGTFLSAMVYCTQSYKSSVDDELKAKQFHEKMTAEGYTKCTLDDLKAAAETDKRFYVVMDGTNMFGSDVKKKVENPLKLKYWKESGYHWMTPRSTRSGWKAKIGQYIKQIK